MMYILEHNAYEGNYVSFSLCVSQSVDLLMEFAENHYNEGCKGDWDDKFALYNSVEKKWIVEESDTNQNFYSIGVIEVI